MAGVARFGGSSGSDLALAAAGWALAAVGLALLAVAQRATAGSSFGGPAGHRGRHGPAGGPPASRPPGSPCWRPGGGRGRAAPALALATLAALASSSPTSRPGTPGRAAGRRLVAVSAQVAHFAAAGVWFGGLAALLLGFRGASAAARAAAVGRFAAAALVCLLVVFATGVLRAVDELASWGDLLGSGYGRAVLAKVVAASS